MIILVQNQNKVVQLNAATACDPCGTSAQKKSYGRTSAHSISAFRLILSLSFMASSPFYLPPPSSSTPPPKPTHTRAPSEPIAPVNLNPTAPATRRSFTDYPLTTHLAFLGGLTAIILPISLVPYLLTKRKLSSLQRTVHALESQTTEMQHRLQSAAIANARTTLTTRAARRRMIPLVQAVRMVGQEVQEVKGAMEKDKYERHEREKKNKVARSDLLYLLEEARIAR